MRFVFPFWLFCLLAHPFAQATNGILNRPVLFVHGINSDAGTWRATLAARSYCQDPALSQMQASLEESGSASGRIHDLAVHYEFTCANLDEAGQTQTLMRDFRQTVKTPAFRPPGAFSLDFAPLEVEATSPTTFVFRGQSDPPPPCGFGQTCYNLSQTLDAPEFMAAVQALIESERVVLSRYPLEALLFEAYEEGTGPRAIAEEYGLNQDYDASRPEEGINHNGIEFYTATYPDQEVAQTPCQNPTLESSAYKTYRRPYSTDWYLQAEYVFACQNSLPAGLPPIISLVRQQLVKTNSYQSPSAFNLSFEPDEQVVFNSSNQSFTFSGEACEFGVCEPQTDILPRADFQNEIDGILAATSVEYPYYRVDANNSGKPDKFAKINGIDTSYNDSLGKWETGQPRQLYDRIEAVLTEYFGETWKSDPTKQIDLVAHSQGGLVIRSLVLDIRDQGNENPMNHIRSIVTLNTPHLGAAIATDHSGIDVVDNIRRVVTERLDNYLGPYTLAKIPSTNIRLDFDPLSEPRMALKNFKSTDENLAYPEGVGAVPLPERPCETIEIESVNPLLDLRIGGIAREHFLVAHYHFLCREAGVDHPFTRTYEQVVWTNAFIAPNQFRLSFEPEEVEYLTDGTFRFSAPNPDPSFCPFGQDCSLLVEELEHPNFEGVIENLVENQIGYSLPAIESPRSSFLTNLRAFGHPTTPSSSSKIPLTAFYGSVPGMANHLMREAKQKAQDFCSSWGVWAGVTGAALAGPALAIALPATCLAASDYLFDRAQPTIDRIDEQWSPQSDFIVDVFSQKGEGVFDPTSPYFSARAYSATHNYVPHMNLLDFKGATAANGEDILDALQNPPGLNPTLGQTGGFESIANWESAAALSLETGVHTEGNAAIRVGGSGYRQLSSTDFGDILPTHVTNRIGFDLFIPFQPVNPWWVGQAQLSIDCPSQGLYNTYIGQVELTDLPRGGFAHLLFEISESIQTALRSGAADLKVIIALNGDSEFIIDNLRSYAETPPPLLPPDRSSSIFGFEDAGVWTLSSGTLSLNPDNFTEGGGSLSIQSAGYTELSSLPLNSSHVNGIPLSVQLDVTIPELQGNPDWVGQLQVFLDAPASGMARTWVGQVELTGLPRGAFTTLEVPLNESARNFFSSGESKDYKWLFVLNVSSGSGAYFLDNLRYSLLE